MNSDLVPAKTFPFRLEAERAQQLLEAAGIGSVVRGDDASGWAPHLGLASGGIALLVKSNELARVRTILEGPDQQ